MENYFNKKSYFHASSMKVSLIIRIVFISTVFQVTQTTETRFYNYGEYDDFEPEMKDTASLNSAVNTLKKLPLNGLSRSGIIKLADIPDNPQEATECASLPVREPDETDEIEKPPPAEKTESHVKEENDIATRQFKNLVQLLYVAQARVQLEATEIKKAQAVANSAQQLLEEAATHVRLISATLQNAQQEVAAAAIRAQTAQLQLAAHDQLLFAARQDVDALSTQLVGLEAAEGITQPKSTVNLPELLEKLKQPLSDSEKPTPVPSVLQIANQLKNQKFQHYNAPDYPQLNPN